MPDDKPPIDRALELFVYAPVGVALYVRDMFPSMLGIFVSRGRREVRSHLGMQDNPPPPQPPLGDIRRRVGESVDMARGVAGGGLGLARDVTESALQGLMSLRNGVGAPPTDESDESIDSDAPLRDEPAPPPSPSPAPATSSPSTSPGASVPPIADPAARPNSPDVESLPIPDYDELSASQVIERLEGLDSESLAAIRAYEAGHRGRNTILGKIAQLG